MSAATTWCVSPRIWACALLLAACSGGSNHGDPPPPNRGDAELREVRWGRLADVYGLRRVGEQLQPELFASDQLLGPDIADDVDVAALAGNSGGGRFDFIGIDADTLQSRLLLPFEIGSPEFERAFAALDDRTTEITPLRLGMRDAIYSVVPRNAALRLRFSRELGIDQDFFTARGPRGEDLGVRNPEAVQLVEITGQDAAGNPTTRPLPLRVAVRGNELIVDPVLLGNEGMRWNARNNPAGMPESPTQTGANIRLLLPLTGPLAIPGLREDRATVLRGVDPRGQSAVVRDFRAGNRADDSAAIARGFVRETEAPQLLGQLPMRLAGVAAAGDGGLDLTIFKAGIVHELDAGDTFAIEAADPSTPPLLTTITADPADDFSRPDEPFVRVRVRAVAGLRERDPRRRADWPGQVPALATWLRANAPVATLHCPFQALRRRPGNVEVRDDPRWFVRFSPAPDLVADAPPVDDLSPFAGAVLRFSKPMDLGTLRPLDTVFFGTRDLLSADSEAAFRAALQIPADRFDGDKYRTPHLIGANLYDEDGTQTTFRLQSLAGFYLDDRMRDAAAAGQSFRYFVHLLGGRDGVTDLAGNALDLGADDAVLGTQVVVPFTVDARRFAGRNAQPDNLVVYCARRFATGDEDEQPSLYRADENGSPGSVPARSQRQDDVFGNHVLLGGHVFGRPPSRVRQVVDNVNQLPPAAQNSVFRWCPTTSIANQTATTPFTQGIQNPLNPFGSRMQTVWREIDLSLSRVDPADMDLDVERIFWAPFRNDAVRFDRFDRISLFLGHAEQRPEPCIGDQSALPVMTESGLSRTFVDNWLHDNSLAGVTETAPAPHTGYIDETLLIDPSLTVFETSGQNRFLPLPDLRLPYFVWRDQTVMQQGGELGRTPLDGSDTVQNRTLPLFPGFNNPTMPYQPYILSPFRNGRGEAFAVANGALQPVSAFWNNGHNLRLANRTAADAATGGLLAAIALPLLCDFQTFCDSPELPVGDPFRAIGTNGWQVSISVQSWVTPAFRAVSGGRADRGTGSYCVSPGTTDWAIAQGGFDLNGRRTAPIDNTLYWTMVDFAKRQTIVTGGFIDLRDPHRIPEPTPDPRLKPLWPAGYLPEFIWYLDPPASRQLAGTAVVPEFRAAGPVDPEPWLWREENVLSNVGGYARPDENNVPLDPRKAGDAHIRKADDRGGRNGWTRYYHRVVTDYVGEPNTLMDPAFTRPFGSAAEPFAPADVRYVNWRLRMTNAMATSPPVSPAVDSFVFAWRLQPER